MEKSFLKGTPNSCSSKATPPKAKISRSKSLRLILRTTKASPECIALIIDYLLEADETMSNYLAVKLTDYLPPFKAAKILLKLYDSADPDLAYEIVDRAERCTGRRIRSLLFDALRAKDPMVRANAAESLGFKKESGAKKVLIRVMQSDAHPIVRACASSALGILGGHLVVRKLFEALKKEKRRMVRLRIMGSLLTLGDASYFDAVSKRLRDRNYLNRGAAVNILSEVRSSEARRAKKTLKNALRNEPARGVRIGIRQALRRLSDPREAEEH